MYDFSWIPCSTYDSPCRELKEWLLEPLGKEMADIQQKAAPNYNDPSLYARQEQLRELYGTICNMDCATLNRKFQELTEKVRKITTTGGDSKERFEEGIKEDLSILEELAKFQEWVDFLSDLSGDSSSGGAIIDLIRNFPISDVQQIVDIYSTIYSEVARVFAGYNPDMARVKKVLPKLPWEVPFCSELNPLKRFAVADAILHLGVEKAVKFAQSIRHKHPLHTLPDAMTKERDISVDKVNRTWKYGVANGKAIPFTLKAQKGMYTQSKVISNILPGEGYPLTFEAINIYDRNTPEVEILIRLGENSEDRDGWWFMYDKLGGGIMGPIANGKYDYFENAVAFENKNEEYTVAIDYWKTGQLWFRINNHPCKNAFFDTGFEERPIVVRANQADVVFKR